MENSIKIKDFKIIRETEKAVLLEVENKLVWFPKLKIKIEKDFIEMDKNFFEDNLKNEVQEKQVQIFLLPEDYTDKVYKLIIPIEKGTYKARKFIFIPKSKVKELKEDSIIFSKWIWDKSLNEILDKEVQYYNSNYDDKITSEDYNINVDVLEI